MLARSPPQLLRLSLHASARLLSFTRVLVHTLCLTCVSHVYSLALNCLNGTSLKLPDFIRIHSTLVELFSSSHKSCCNKPAATLWPIPIALFSLATTGCI